jgi:transcriptional regulator with XRE-family HTH domain
MNKIRALFKSKNIKIKDVAKMIGITERTLNQKINGEVTFLKRDTDIILSVLNMKYEDVFTNDKDKYITIIISNKKYFISELTANRITNIIDKEAI